MQLIHEASDEVSHCIAPIVLPGSADEITGGVVNVGSHFTLAAAAMHGDQKRKLPKPRTHPHGPAKPGHELFTM
jgi:hypothetical protein